MARPKQKSFVGDTMPKTITIQYDNLSQGAKVEVPGLGVFPNGETSQVDDERLSQYEATGHAVPDGDFEYPVPPENDSPVVPPQGSEETPVDTEPVQAEQAPEEAIQ
jgi:hypothetical protein